MPVASLPSLHGIGDFGPSSYEFVDFLVDAGFSIWQILPLNPLGYGNSPYQPYSSNAMDDLYISLELLNKEGLVQKAGSYNRFDSTIDYDEVRAYKQHFLRLAFKKFKKDEKYEEFIKFDWVYNYAVFLTFKKNNRLICWNDWPGFMKDWIVDNKLDLSPYEKDIEFELFVQYTLYKQWNDLKSYANSKGILIMGDMPIYVGIDSDDVWANQDLFLLDKKGRPTHVAGVPPDYFSETGQRWGNPLYDWPKHKSSGFKFWIDRLEYNSRLFDIIRIDHFRAFDTYYKIPELAPTAETGEWVEAPGYAFFDEILATFPHLKIIAEDLGDLRPEVLKLRDHYNFPGMEIVQFTYQGSKTKPEKYHTTNRIIYPGTHDNQTTYGWFGALEKEEQRDIVSDLARRGFNYDSVIDQLLAYTFASDADIAIIPMQDVLSLDDRARFNVPGTIGSPNWEWKLKDFKETKLRLPFIEFLTKKYNR